MSKEAELSVLSSMIMKNEAICVVAEKLTTEMFTHQYNRDIFDKMVELELKNIPVDEVQLKSMDIPIDYLLQVLDREPHGESAEYHADIVIESYRISQINLLGATVARLGSSGRTSDEIYPEIEKALRTAEGDSREDGIQHSSEVEVKFEADSGEYIKTQYKLLNKQIMGFRNGQLIIVCGSSSMGKTSFMLDLLRHIVHQKSMPAALFSCEMSNRENMERMCCTLAEVGKKKIEFGRATPEDIANVQEAARQLKEKPLYLDKTPGLTPASLKRKLTRIHRLHGIKIAFVDHLHRMTSGIKIESRRHELAYISKSISDMAVTLGIPIVLGAQVNRSCALRDNKRPGMHDLRDCGEIEEAADTILNLFRPSQFQEDGGDELRVIKGRDCGTGFIPVEFIGELTTFRPGDEQWAG